MASANDFMGDINPLPKQIITVQLGEFHTDYVVKETTAPAAYDQFGTFELVKVKNTRIVLIEERHYQGQVGRYGSGLHAVADVERYVDNNDIRSRLYQRLIAPRPGEV